MTDESTARAGMRVVFWGWLVVIAAGLAVMVSLPLMGR